MLSGFRIDDLASLDSKLSLGLTPQILAKLIQIRNLAAATASPHPNAIRGTRNTISLLNSAKVVNGTHDGSNCGMKNRSRSLTILAPPERFELPTNRVETGSAIHCATGANLTLYLLDAHNISNCHFIITLPPLFWNVFFWQST